MKYYPVMWGIIISNKQTIIRIPIKQPGFNTKYPRDFFVAQIFTSVKLKGRWKYLDVPLEVCKRLGSVGHNPKILHL